MSQKSSLTSTHPICFMSADGGHLGHVSDIAKAGPQHQAAAKPKPKIKKSQRKSASQKTPKM
jgi:hypothetical protein